MLEGFYEWVGQRAEQGYLPSFLRHSFQVRALLATLLLGPLFGIISPLVVTKRLAFFSAALGHSALAGVSLGILLGGSFEHPYAGMFGFSLLMALAITYTRQHSGLPADTVIGVFLSFSLGLGICLLAAVAERFDMHQVEGLLFGNILTVTDGDLLVLLGAGIAALALLLPIFNQLFLASLDPALARSRGVPVVRNDYLFMVVLTLLVIASIKITGALLVEALVIVPAAAARHLAVGLRSWILLSAGLALVGCQLGLVLSGGTFRVPTGATIVLVLTAEFFLIFLIRLLGRRGS